MDITETYILLQNLCVPNKPEEKSYEDLVSLLNEYYCRRTNVFAERCKFYAAIKSANESIQNWTVKLRSLGVKCELGAQLEDILRYRFICGLNPGKIMDRMLDRTPIFDILWNRRKSTICMLFIAAEANSAEQARVPALLQHCQEVCPAQDQEDKEAVSGVQIVVGASTQRTDVSFGVKNSQLFEL
ncbi:hypothetical protein JTB14_038486 [Gonioctena quinquepunctata]|nr:hypothetical protein JTB14_038486 [Gonioctena quinquepunctata]